jgi:hypothetical protein
MNSRRLARTAAICPFLFLVGTTAVTLLVLSRLEGWPNDTSNVFLNLCVHSLSLRFQMLLNEREQLWVLGLKHWWTISLYGSSQV